MAIGNWTLTGHFDTLSGFPATGTVRIDGNPQIITDSSGNKVRVGPRTVVLNGTGDFSVTLPSDVTTGNSAAIAFRVTTKLTGLTNIAPLNFYARPIGSTVDLRSLLNVAIPEVSIAPTGPPGPPGPQGNPGPAGSGIGDIGLDTDGIPYFDLSLSGTGPSNTAVAAYVSGAGFTKTALDAAYSRKDAGPSVVVTAYGATGDGSTSDTAAITSAIAALPSTGGRLHFPKGTYMAANLTLNKSNVTVTMDEGAIIKKNANGPVLSWGSGGFTKCDFQGLRIDGNGANFTGAGLVINGGTFPRLVGGEITNTASNPMQFVGDGAGHSARVSDMILFAYDALSGGTNQTVAAISLPLDSTQAPNRHFSNIQAAGTYLFTDAGSQDSNFVQCTARNLAYTGTPAKLYLTSCRIASSGAAVTLTGTQCMWTGNAFAGAVTLSSSNNSTMVGNIVAGPITVAAGCTANVVGPNNLSGKFTDLGTSTNVVGSQEGTFMAPHTIDPRMLSATSTLNTSQAVYMRARGRGYVSKIAVHVGVSSGNICVGAYNNSGTGSAARPSTQKATSGSVACPAAGYAEVALTSPVYVEEGDWLSLVADNTTASFYRGNAGGFSSTLANGFSHHQNSAFPLPATASPTTGAIFSLILVGVA